MTARAPAHVAFGRSLRRLRLELCLSQEQLAVRVPFSTSGLSRLENGHGGCSLDTADLIAAALGSDVTTMIRAGGDR